MGYIEVERKPRIKALDSLRGIASLSVVICHVLGLQFYQFLRVSPFNIIRAGHEAVIFFFVLSGYVLTYQYSSREVYSYPKFLLHRIIRIYIPYIVSFLLCVAFLLLCKPVHLGKAWVHIMWQVPITRRLTLMHILFIGNFDTMAFNPVIWSLIHEMRMSILFPVLLYFLKLKPAKAFAILFTVSITAMVGIALQFEPLLGYLNNFSYTLYYFYIFFAGGLIARHQQALSLFYSSLSSIKKHFWLYAQFYFTIIQTLFHLYLQTVICPK